MCQPFFAITIFTLQFQGMMEFDSYSSSWRIFRPVQFVVFFVNLLKFISRKPGAEISPGPLNVLFVRVLFED